MPASKAPAPATRQGKKSEYQDKEKPAAIRQSNISAAKGNVFANILQHNYCA